MKTIKFHKIKIRNFMSFGDEITELDFTNGLNLITGFNRDMPESKNGIGKCLDPKTEIIISIADKTVLERFKKLTEKKINKR